jgi:Outer membrane protein beta-barrel domain
LKAKPPAQRRPTSVQEKTGEKIQKEKDMRYTNGKIIKRIVEVAAIAAALVCLLVSPGRASAQQNLELAGGWTHITGNFGQDGFNFGAAWNFTNKVQIAADYDTAWKNARIGTFETTPVGAVTVHNHLQDWMFGPRIFFGTGQIRQHRINTFGEVQFGWSHLGNSIEAPTFPSISNSDTAFSWLLGGGGDYVFSSHWSVRGKLDFLRTHFASAGQSRLRLGIGVTYTFANRER